ncbi:MAG: hypothetical protein AABY22_07100 [Nanoarchaeota archaeon]
MATLISNSGMPLTESEKRLVLKNLDADPCSNISVYDLYELNMLCHMVKGYIRK